jgi:hypothetical protein
MTTMITNYLSEEHMTSLIERVTKLRDGRKLTGGAKAPYCVIVDGGQHRFRAVTGLRKFLEGCTFPDSYKMFRNAYGGVTIDLDT